MSFVSSKKARQILGVSGNTLRSWAAKGSIRFIRTESGYRRYDLSSVFPETDKRRVCYCRVSSAKQKDDHERQKAFMQDRYPEHEVVTDIGSGLNFKRPGMRALLESCVRGDVEEIVVAHRDRLARFGSQLFEVVLSVHGGRLLVLEEESLSPEEELTRDLLSIIHVFSCRLHGLRKYGNKIKKDQNLSHS
jgi:predicted site-specific integrase-resolvase